MQTCILAVVPWQEAQTPTSSALFVERILARTGPRRYRADSRYRLRLVFSATLGYSRVPYAAALDGNFFSIFARVHPTKRFPDVSLIALGLASIFFCIFIGLFSTSYAPSSRCAASSNLWPRPRLDEAPSAMEGGPLALSHVALPRPSVSFHRRLDRNFYFDRARPMLASLAAMLAGILVYFTRARLLHQWPFEEAV